MARAEKKRLRDRNPCCGYRSLAEPVSLAPPSSPGGRTDFRLLRFPPNIDGIGHRRHGVLGALALQSHCRSIMLVLGVIRPSWALLLRRSMEEARAHLTRDEGDRDLKRRRLAGG